MAEVIEFKKDGKERLSCGTCDAWDKYPDEKQSDKTNLSGKCRLNPGKPQVVLVPVRTVQGDGMAANVITGWPETTESDYCMEHFTENSPEPGEEVH